ncbi:MAG: energy transducer TonB [Pyrinomonadaceae bacterium]
MKYCILSLLFLVIFAVGTMSQTPQADADPVLQGSATYKLPQSAIDAEIDGKVTLSVHVDKTGKPTKAVLVTGLIWPCGKMPTKAMDEISKTLSETVMKLQFSPAIKNNKPISKDFGLSITLKNPKVNSEPVEKDPTTGKPKAKQITAGVLNGKATSLPKPDYPGEAKVIRAGGAVPVQVLFDEAGKVIRAGAVGGHPMLQLPARESACGAKFEPVSLEGKPIKVTGVITYNFVPH